ncbi:putative peptidoglycan binding protein [Flavobacterium croceum DSM 17960]|uniref:Putative peptidoglycan binding protein n=1 Tax=Flavobacterium croceum DSM 17960 TaxID=1121886 RepID=A0A2S4NBH4_9FLAO|nr:peptidoglycan-binding protein [Flavobacterium croceum]POS03052.1 putative peptidoglycan binding protein [Flavobacterium croceum DSM 17960]
MKQLIILLLSIIVLFIGIHVYTNYQRFHGVKSEYKTQATLDLNYYDTSVITNYYRAVEELNSYVRMQWAENSIDVRLPQNDTQETKDALLEYNKKLAEVKRLENKLSFSAQLKKQGFNNQDVQVCEQTGSTIKYNDWLSNNFLIQTYRTNPEKYSLKIGDYNSFVYELQKKLVQKGYKIPVDGLYRDITQKAVGQFELKHNLLPDGKVDSMMLAYLLK